jgi:hypothetical protein
LPPLIPQHRPPEPSPCSSGSPTSEQHHSDHRSDYHQQQHFFLHHEQQHQDPFSIDSSIDFDNSLAWTTSLSSLDSSNLLPTVPAPELQPLDWSCPPLASLPAAHESLEFDFNTVPQPTFTDFDVDQFLSPAGSVSPSTSVEVPEHESNGAMGAFTITTTGPSLTLTPLTMPSSHPSPAMFPGLASKPTRQASPPSPVDHQDLLIKRHRNNIAAKKYRQKKVDRIKELEDEVADVKRERDDLRIRLARQEAETAALREMLAGKIGRSVDVRTS